jgi:hypothetical protein
MASPRLKPDLILAPDAAAPRLAREAAEHAYASSPPELDRRLRQLAIEMYRLVDALAQS